MSAHRPEGATGRHRLSGEDDIKTETNKTHMSTEWTKPAQERTVQRAGVSVTV
jgi:hypothetical protein